MTQLPSILAALANSGVEVILVGGMAGIAHGSSRVTLDIDFVYCRSESNIERLASALAALKPTLRGAPPGLPFKFDAATIRAGLNFTLQTSLGAVDLLGEIAGGGTYDSLLAHTELLQVFGHPCRVVNLDRLIMLKRAAGRPKDLEAIAELESLRRPLA